MSSLLSRVNSPSPREQTGADDEGRRPDPCQLRSHHAWHSRVEQTREADGRDGDRPHWKEVTGIVERCEQCHAESAIGQCIQEAVRHERERQKGPDHPRTEGAGSATIHQQNSEAGQEYREREAVAQAPMAEEIPVLNAETEADDIEIRKRRAQCPEGPEPFRHSGTVEAGRDSHGGDGVSGSSGHGRMRAEPRAEQLLPGDQDPDARQLVQVGQIMAGVQAPHQLQALFAPFPMDSHPSQGSGRSGGP